MAETGWNPDTGQATGTYQQYVQSGGKASEAEWRKYNNVGGSGPAKPAAKASPSTTQQIQVGGRLYNPDATFYYSSGVGGPDLITAEQAARIAPTMNYGKGLYGAPYDSSGYDSWTSYEGYMDLADAGTEPKAAAPAAPARHAGGGGGGGSRPAAAAPPADYTKPLIETIDKAKETDIKKPAQGLESTIKTSPELLRERRRRTFLTAGNQPQDKDRRFTSLLAAGA